MKKVVLISMLFACSATAGAMTVGQVMGALEQDNQAQRQMVLQYWNGSLEMALTINAHLTEAGSPLFCLPQPGPDRETLFNNFVRDVGELVEDRGVKQVARLAATEITLRGLAKRYRECE